MFQNGLTWPQALALAMAGAYVRRELWTDKRLFRTDGGLVWVDGSPSRVVQTADFGRDEFLAKDWTNMGFDQGDCLPHPGFTRLLINETQVITNPQEKWEISAPPGGRATWANPFSVARRARLINSAFGGAAEGWIALSGFTLLDPWQTPNHPSVTTDAHYLVAPGATIIMTAGGYSLYASIEFQPDGIVIPPLQRVVSNPFSAACSVQITGTAADALLLNGVEVPLPVTFSLMDGASFTLAALLRNPATQPVASLDLEVDFSL